MIARHFRVWTALLAVMLLVTWQGRFTAAQGVTTSMEAMHASGSAAATEADKLLELVRLAARSASHTSARQQGKGWYNGSFSSSTQFEALQAATYQIASSYQYYGSWDPSQNPQGTNLLPRVRNQGECYTAVAHAVASAVEAAVAAATGTNASQWDVSPQSLHYCSGHNRTCDKGWTLQEALDVVVNQAPGLLRPSKCGRVESSSDLLDDSYAADTTAQTWAEVCSSVQHQCSHISDTTPWLQCAYKPLKTFWEVQQHVRNHGAVLTTMVVHDDFDSHFAAAAKGRHAKPYRPSPTASILYAQPAVIVGYSNMASANYEPSFTVLTSWGTRDTHAGPRKAAITTDGMYRIAMGAAGVGSPDGTFGVQCHPAPGSESDPHASQSWRVATAKHVELDQPTTSGNLTQQSGCYMYKVQSGDTAASIADAFNIPVTQLVSDNMQLFNKTSRSYSFPFPMTLQHLTQTLTTVTNATAAYTSIQTSKSFKPFVLCWMMTDQNATKCYLDNLTPCYNIHAAYGLVPRVNRACTLHYPDLAVARNSLWSGQLMRTCNVGSTHIAPDTLHTSDVAHLAFPPKVSQPQAVAALIVAVAGADAAASYHIPPGSGYCHPSKYSPVWHAEDAPVKLWSATQGGSRYACDAEGYITYLSLGLGTDSTKGALLNDTRIVSAVLQLPRLQVLEIMGAGGSLPPQFGALERLQRLTIRQRCLTGTVPGNYGLYWPEMSSLNIVPMSLNGRINPATAAAVAASDGAACGLTGRIPASMLSNLAPNLRQLQLQGNNFTGALPPVLANMTRLCWLNLRDNRLSSSIPKGMQTMFGACSGEALLDLSNNNLSGEVPPGLSRLPAQKVILSNNPLLANCLSTPINSSTAVEFTATSISAEFCEVVQAREQQEQQQYEALAKYLPKLITGRSAFVRDFLNNTPSNLSAWFRSDNTAGASYSKTLRDPSGHGRVSIGLTRLNGTVYITQVTGNHVGLDTAILAELAMRLPQLQSYNFKFCDKHSVSTPQNSTHLPWNLAQAAPASFRALSLANCHIQGNLPQEWSNWSTLEELWISGNDITGTLPGAWAEGMKSLRILYAERNQLGGLLPASWGSGVMPSMLFMNLNTNPDLFGTIPSSWGRFEGLVWIERTAIRSCIPQPMMDNIITDDTYRVGDIACPVGPPKPADSPAAAPKLPRPVAALQPKPVPDNMTTPTTPGPDSQTAPELAALKGIKGLFGRPAALPGWVEDARSHSSGTTVYCSWPGIACNPNKQVTALNLTHAVSTTNTTATAVDFAQLMQHVKQFSSVHTLHLASLRLHGELPAEIVTQLKNLRYFNISGNPGVSGTLPKRWAALTSLQHLDVSRSNVSGLLPEGYVALQQLRIFRASQTLLSGSLPTSWGLLRSLNELDISLSNLTGAFPRWGSAEAVLAIAASKADAAKAAASEAVAAAAAAREVLAAAGEQQARIASLQAALKSVHPGRANPPIVAVAMDAVDPLQALRAGIVQYRQALETAEAATAIARSLQAATDAAAAAAAPTSRITQMRRTAEQSANGSGSATVATAAVDQQSLVLGSTLLQKVNSSSTTTGAITLISMHNKSAGAGIASESKTVHVKSISSTGSAPTSSNSSDVTKAGKLYGEALRNGSTVVINSISGTILPQTSGSATNQTTRSVNLMGSVQQVFTRDRAPDATQVVHASQQSMSTGSFKLKAETWSTVPNPSASNITIMTAGTIKAADAPSSSNASTVTSVAASSAGFMQLKVLRLQGNHLTGHLPDDISNLKQLKTLDLSGNELSGSLPNSLAELNNLQELLLSGNNLDGMLPHYYARLSTLIRLDLSNNTFRGMVPPTWVGMKAAVMINVANNQLIGPIPNDLALMAGPMHNLHCLLVYGNQFEQQSVQNMQTLLQSRPYSRMKLIIDNKEQHLCNRPKESSRGASARRLQVQAAAPRHL